MKRPIEEVISSAFDAVSRRAYSVDQTVDLLRRNGMGKTQLIAALVTVCRDLIDANNQLEGRLDTAERQVELQSDYISTLEASGRK